MRRLFAPVRATRRHLPSLIGACAVIYFGYHALQGERGLMTLLALQHKVAEVQIELHTVADEKATLEKHVELMRPQSLDRDMLEERARAVLNYTRPDEVVIMRDNIDRSSGTD
jgi:cell division protein FtsB